MCGISGFLGHFDRAELERMNGSLEHRGPDDQGVHLEPGVGLAHRRLSIIDLASGQQPMTNEDGSLWIVFNGEIYNHLSLRQDLVANHEFATRCDTEVILHLYEELGPACVDRLQGMFSFAIWDGRQRTLFLARDRFGIKPLYWTRTPRGFAFASEIKAFLEISDFKRQLAIDSLDSYLTFRYVTGAKTMFENVFRLEPGHVMEVSEKDSRTRRYWDLDFEPKTSRPLDEAADELRQRLSDSIEARLMSEVPLGAFLSGGLDSSMIVGLMSGLKSDPVETFTVSLGGDWHDESSFASEVASRFQTNHHVLRVRDESAGILGKTVWFLDEPMADAATIPTYLMSKLTREYVTVVLSGEGADELLGGYAKYKALQFGRLGLNPLTRLLSKPLGAVMGSRITPRRLFEFLGSTDFASAYVALVAVFNEREKAALLGPRLAALRGAGQVVDEVRGILDAAGDKVDTLDRLAYLDIHTWLPNDVLLKTDRMTMAHGLEGRVPFLDHELAEFLSSIPSNFKLKGTTEKYILREAMKPLIPESIRRRRKHGFTVPIAQWMKGELTAEANLLLGRERLQERGLWNPDYVEKLLQQDFSNEYYRRQLWTLLTFEKWHQVFLE